ncbi:MAG: DUF262 domain-containing protein [Desulfomonile tiedjei]|uniref:DUF262 domain-containing protein n=1 Tax=Desulfomonile tiedjei TaxID=2358 RepID=A0A9D6Z4N0_9BACT|nr:DUF262 domain-containing protein [Desulfomonile tiedjei]
MNGNTPFPVARLFDRKLFRVPHYQRGYSWEDEQLEDFWGDIQNMPQRGHYTGDICLEQVVNPGELQREIWRGSKWIIDEGYQPYYVIDGQQRLTTIVILMQVIAEELQDGERLGLYFKEKIIADYIYQQLNEEQRDFGAYIFGYAEDHVSFEYFKSEILRHQADAFRGIHTTYTKNLKNAKGFFKNNVPKDRIALRELLRRITQGLKFDMKILNNDPDIYVRFETINNRGKALTTLELLKNRLLHLSTLLPDAIEEQMTGLQDRVKTCWGLIYEFLGKNEEKPLDDDDFLRHHWIISFRDVARKESGGVHRSLLSERFTMNRVARREILFDDINSYVTSLQESVKDWYKMYNPQASDFGSEMAAWLERLNRLGYRVCASLVLATLSWLRRRRRSDEAEAETSLRLATDMLKAVERYIFVVFEISQRRSDAGQKDFYKWAYELCNGSEINAIIDQIDSRTDGFYSIEYFWHYLREQFHGGDDKGWYGWSGLPYFLYEYNNGLQEFRSPEHELDWGLLISPQRGTITIEHVYPQTPEAGEWAAMDVIDPKHRIYLLGSLGNLVALSKQKNSSLGNDSFDLKKRRPPDDRHAIERGYFNGSYAEMEIAEEADWTPQSIKARGHRMLAFMAQRWRITISDEERDKLLLIPFVQ